jgi:hypothetical protein
MIMGVALLGTITASIASNFNLTDSGDSSKEPYSSSDVDGLKRRIAELESKIEK